MSLQSAPIANGDMKKVARPAGMPIPYQQPDSTGWFDEKEQVRPDRRGQHAAASIGSGGRHAEQADRDGAHWIVGTMGRQIESYMDKFHPGARLLAQASG